MPSDAAPAAAAPAMSARACEALSAIAREEAGLVLGAGKRSMMEGRLGRRLRGLGLGDYDSYVELVRADGEERRRAVEALTTHHTGFFREPHHFRHLARVALPELVARAFAGGRVRLWSSASSTGEEPYSIAMTFLQEATALGGARWLERADVAVLATDIALDTLAVAAAGRYPLGGRDTIPAPLGDRWTVIDGDGFTIGDDARGLVAHRPLNLLADWPMRGKFDVIFCRNVAIYFDEATRSRLWERLADALAPAGWLYIGHSERVAGPAAARLTPMGQTIYRRTGEP